MAKLVEYKGWCADKAVDPSFCVVIEGVSEVGFSKATVRNHLKHLDDAVDVVDHREAGDDRINVLCQFKKGVATLNVPSTIQITDEMSWKVVVLEVPSDFDSLLAAFLKSHNKEGYLEQKQKEKGDTDTPPQVIQHVVTTANGSSGRRLRPFSGRMPTPNGEWDFATWRQVVATSLLHSSLTGGQQRSTIVDSLLPPALDILHDVSAAATPQVIVDALNKAYGMVKSGDDLYADFRDAYQHAGEGAAEYLVRLNSLLIQVIQHDGLPSERGDASRLDQFLRGCLYDDDLIINLQLRQRRNHPPSYVNMLLEIRGEEARRSERERRRGAEPAKPSSSHKVVKVQQQTAASVSSADSRIQQELADLRKQIAELTTRPPPPQYQQRTQRRQPRSRSSTFCYKCGEDGHRVQECAQKANPSLVQQKLLARASGNGQEPSPGDQRSAQQD